MNEQEKNVHLRWQAVIWKSTKKKKKKKSESYYSSQ